MLEPQVIEVDLVDVKGSFYLPENVLVECPKCKSSQKIKLKVVSHDVTLFGCDGATLNLIGQCDCGFFGNLVTEANKGTAIQIMTGTYFKPLYLPKGAKINIRVVKGLDRECNLTLILAA